MANGLILFLSRVNNLKLPQRSASTTTARFTQKKTRLQRKWANAEARLEGIKVRDDESWLKKQPNGRRRKSSRKKMGIFIYSTSYSILLTTANRDENGNRSQQRWRQDRRIVVTILPCADRNRTMRASRAASHGVYRRLSSLLFMILPPVLRVTGMYLNYERDGSSATL